MKKITTKYKLLLGATLIAAMGLSSCEDFLDRPDKTTYTLSEYYQSDAECFQAANILYTIPWYDFFRGWIGVGDVQSGNYYKGSDGFWKLTQKDGSVDDILAAMSASLWAVNARANTVVENINQYAGGSSTEAGRNAAKGEVLVWKGFSYFFMTRIFGAVPIVHNNTELMNTGEYNQLYRAKTENVYDYIIMTLEQAAEWLPETPEKGRLGKYSAYGLLAKVYLTKAGYGQSGTRNQADLDQAKAYAKLVVDHYNYWLEPEYANLFRGSYNYTEESLISWRWVMAADSYWTCSNALQCDLGLKGFDEFDAWGNWTGPSLDLQTAFGEDATKLTRNNFDKRRKATMMMYGDVYENFWRDHPTKAGAEGDVTFPNGFDWTKYCRDVLSSFDSSTGANCVKHLVGNNNDHIAEIGVSMGGMKTGLATHLLRLADVYLIYAEAILGNSESTSDAAALKAFNTVRARAIPNATEKESITFDDIWNERRLELALEGDFWYDFVRLSYYKPDVALAKLNAQNRKNYLGLNDFYKAGTGEFGDDNGKPTPRVNDQEPTGQPYSISVFTMPFPETDLQMNPNLAKEPIDYDLSQYTY